MSTVRVADDSIDDLFRKRYKKTLFLLVKKKYLKANKRKNENLNGNVYNRTAEHIHKS